LEEIASLFHGFAVVIEPFNLVLMLIGITLGVIIGVLPGLGGANGVAILLPLTFSMPPTSAIIMLSCIYWGALFGGAITSILFNIPGEPWSVATTFDGHPMAQQGRAGEALTAAFTSSFVGAFVAVIVITFLAPLVAKFALRFGPPEFFAVQFLTFCSFIGMGRGSPFKTLAAMTLGFALAAVGLDTVTGQLRMTFGSGELLRGFDFLIAVIGLFGIGEILLSMEEGLSFKGKTAALNAKVVLHTWKKLPRYWATSLRASAIGCWMGITPGGATPASFMSYGIAKRMSKNGDKFGKGEIEGVIAPETAAHAAGTSALLPMITLGIPGSPTAQMTMITGATMLNGMRRIAAKSGTQVSTTSSPAMLPRYMLAISPHTKSFCSTKSSGPGCRPQISRPPSSTAAVGEPGMPSVIIGSSALVPAACAAVSGAMTPSISPLPNLSPFFDMRLAMP
jgi:putative tricarboxylic transport membrane protein